MDLSGGFHQNPHDIERKVFVEAAVGHPIYTVYVVAGKVKYNLSPVTVSLQFQDQQEQLAQSLTVSLMNVQVSGKWLSSLLGVRQRIFVFADDGEKNEEVFRGYIWSRAYQSALEERELTLKCYDNLIYFQESEEAEYFSDGKSTSDVISTLCGKWGVQVEYSYESITHAKLALRGTLADIITSDLLNLVVDRTAKDYVIRSEKDVVKILGLGQNPKVYSIQIKQNAVSTKSQCTMDGLVTKVVILGKADEDQREPVEATLTQGTDEYGTLQKVIRREENTSLADAQQEAQGILDHEGSPTWEYEVSAADIPWIRKGDKVFVDAGDIEERTLIVTSISRTISAKQGATMALTLERPE